MDSLTLLSQAQAAGLTVSAEGDRLVVRGPRSAEALALALLTHKAELMPLLAASDAPVEAPCPRCSATDWWHGPDGTTACHACLIVGRELLEAVKVHSDVLDADLWVVADDLPPDQWPPDAPVYTHAEVKILTQVGQDVLEWVHAVKEAFGAKVVSARQHPPRASDNEPGIEEGSDASQ